MRSFEIAFLELKRLLSTRMFRLALAVVCLVPLLYGVLYLWAFWDPYQRLDRLPVALVVQDRPSVVAGKTVHVGEDLVAQLKKSDSFDWQVVSAAAAAKGLQDHDYYMTLTVPGDFSSRLAHADGDHPQHAVLQVRANESSNLLASQIGGRVFLEIQSSLAGVTSRRYLNNIFVGLGDLRSGMSRAGRGAGRLAGALGRASGGSNKLTTGLGTVDAGARTLNGGLRDLSAGADRLHAGAARAASGAGRLATGVRAAGSGARSVAAGSRSLATGSQSLASGLATLFDLSGTLKSSAQQIANGAAQVDDGASSAAERTAAAATAAGQLAGGAAQVRQALAAYAQAHPDAAADATFQAALSGAGQVSGGLTQLSDSLDAAKPQMQQLAGGGAQVSGGAQKLASGLGDYSAAVGRASAGAQKLYGGAESLSSGAGQLAGGVSAASAATQKLAAGTRSLAHGSTQLQTGAVRARAGSASLTVGLSRLVSGGTSLSTGLANAASGGVRLAGKLAQGAAGLPAFTPQARRARAAMMAAPVKVTTTRDHPVPNYGTGFAPYFIPLALWVGALMTYFLVRPFSGRALASTLSDPHVALAGLWPAVAVTWLQAVVMLLVLQFALGLDPVQPLAFYAFTLVAALTYTAIMQLLSAAFGVAGKFIAVVLLMLQLTSSAGTFPIETAPRFFQIINPYLPMTYVVTGLRQAISGGDLRSIAFNALILLGYAAGAVVLVTLTAHRRRTWTMDRLKPVLTL
jgi:putative membrane protein